MSQGIATVPCQLLAFVDFQQSWTHLLLQLNLNIFEIIGWAPQALETFPDFCSVLGRKILMDRNQSTSRIILFVREFRTVALEPVSFFTAIYPLMRSFDLVLAHASLNFLIDFLLHYFVAACFPPDDTLSLRKEKAPLAVVIQLQKIPYLW
mmetsp:Transcript_72486/g.125789  ORF Transcript_72486/g.125789 Transcript_72486/m.125789 type:complete len:151 (+) Transcript_72486:51-503(+)